MVLEERSLPGREVRQRVLHFIYICDCSGSMGMEGKIEALNNAIRESIPHMQEAASQNVGAKVLVRAVKFSDTAQWHVADKTDVLDFQWEDLTADGRTAMGEALNLVAEELKIPPMEEHAIPPVLLLVSDGQPTDDFESGLAAIEALNWGKKAVRLAIAIGKDADEKKLKRFMGSTEAPVLHANNPDQLKLYIRWASTVVVSTLSQPKTDKKGEKHDGMWDAGNAKIPVPQVTDEDVKKDETW